MATDVGKLQKRKNIIWPVIRKRDASRENFKGIHVRFLRDNVFRKCVLEHDQDENVSLKWDDLAEQDFTYRMSESEYLHYRQNWWISLNKSGNTGGPLRNKKLEDNNSGPYHTGSTSNGKPSSSSSSTWWQWSGSWLSSQEFEESQ